MVQVFQLLDIELVAAIISFALCALIVRPQRWHGKHTHDYDLDGVQKLHASAGLQ